MTAPLRSLARVAPRVAPRVAVLVAALALSIPVGVGAQTPPRGAPPADTLPTRARQLESAASAVNTAPYTSAKLTVRDAWARPARKGATGAVYLTLDNIGGLPIRIVEITTPTARAVEAHETMQHGGMAHMQPVKALDVPARGRLAMKPGGVHLMLVDLQRTLAVGDKVALTLRTSDGATVMLTATVRAN